MTTAFGSRHSFLLAYEQSMKKQNYSQFLIVSFEVFCGLTSIQFLLVKGCTTSVNLAIIWYQRGFRFFPKRHLHAGNGGVVELRMTLQRNSITES
jgi:hypothetical protein